MRWIYTIAIFVYVLAIRIAALTGNRKAKLWIQGRKGLIQQYRILFTHEQPQHFLWFHVSSLGEFEQGRPVIELMRKAMPDKKILLTFFSPSGYEIRKDYKYADVVLYLPFDCLRLMRKFVAIVQPAAVIFVKYDFWFNFITACKEHRVPVFFITSAFRPTQYFFSWWATWFRKQLQKVDCFFVQTHESIELLKRYNISQCMFAGDTRLDRVLAIRNESVDFPHITQWINGRKVLVAGSTWPVDERFLKNWIMQQSDVCMIIAPHDVSQKRLSEVEQQFAPSVVRLSNLNNQMSIGQQCLIVDTIGKLAYLYRYAHVAYIGNGFGKGIHNILEAVVYGKPVVFGPNYHKFTEAVALVKQGGAFTFTAQDELDKIMEQLFSDSLKMKQANDACLNYVEQHAGATQIIVNEIIQRIKYHRL